MNKDDSFTLEASKTPIYFDGMTYDSESDVPNLGSWVCVGVDGDTMRRNYQGLSADLDKLPHYIKTGSSALCLDTSDCYIFCEADDTWHQI